ncbi:hypothetical protein A2954_00895 [Candidatus Roizmanbacteria bacterium RIFCSPLOWO2_01_FULL_37_12]|uniref:PhnB-like domain-containing protein n=1 Tax=Candidatus Roizmanbacteria bacterium RIFCSPLOWO2_01_FULL_37_12 TaxID=1802056 RepID=A0A1F7IGA9_9BACT|nr:MAG: hypothetical protein A3D76_06895 [Candidatus Roizmanbacteria bacterium RIFCSPHIGHO2_02_FULL_37_9b]OGK42385.1 MAG: hypothetical protein A2954_00895 [Candidatus Roizmanbacteria bacterium RIFCSPLOWO2_01_FULL_37_12]
MKKLVIYIWMDNETEEAVKFYKKVFGSNLIVGATTKYLTETPSNKPIGSVMMVEFELFGQRFALLNGGSFFKPSEATSFLIECKDQNEIDKYWKALSADPKAEVCGWLKDKFGISWQIIPKQLGLFLTDKNKEKAKRVMNAMLKMKKIDIVGLRRAYEGK